MNMIFTMVKRLFGTGIVASGILAGAALWA